MRRARRVRLVPLLQRMRGRRVLASLLALSGLTSLVVAGLFACFHDRLIDEARFVRPLDAVLVVDRDGRPLRRHAPDGVDTRWVPLEEVSPALIDAFIAAEDERFYDHGGLDGIALARALLGNLTGGRLSGASTITQQVVKMVYGRPHGLLDKPIEMARALELESRMTKAEILEQYLNRVPMGNGIIGVARAAEVYFGHDVGELTMGEAAMLAGIPQAPSITEPRRHLPRALARRAYVLRRIRELGLRSPEEVDAAEARVPEVRRDAPRPYVAPRFVDWVLAERRDHAIADPVLRTSLDRRFTERAAERLREAITPRRSRGVENGAALAIDVRTGEVLVYVGAALPGAEGGALDLLRARRQPGSTLKPFAYELLFEGGEGPATLLDDVSTGMTLGDGSSFVARDFDGHERGPVRARVALGSSLNLAAIDAVRRVGADHFVDRLAALSFSRADGANRESAALVLGGIDVTAIELAQAYAVLAGGRSNALTPWRVDSEEESEPILDPVAAALTRDVLFDGEVRRSAFGATLEAEAGGAFGLKTGTSEGFHDAWAVAFDARFVVVVWLGSPARRAMDHVSGFEGAAPVAASVLGWLREDAPRLASHEPSMEATVPVLATVQVCALSGALPGPGCAHTVAERFDPAHVPHASCTLHDGAGAVHLPERYAGYLARNPLLGASTALSEHPRVSSPRDGAILVVDRDTTEIPLRGDGAIGFEVDGVPVRGDGWNARVGLHEVVAVGVNSRSPPIYVTVRSVN